MALRRYARRVACWYEQDQLGKLVKEIQLNNANAIFEPISDASPYYLRFFQDGGKLIYQPVFTTSSYTYRSVKPPKLPPLSTQWVY